MRNKHADLIHAWAEGAEIQYRSPSNPSKEWLDAGSTLLWWEPNEYRIKPATKTIKYRNYITQDGRMGVVVEGVRPTKDCTWVGDWQEVEVKA